MKKVIALGLCLLVVLVASQGETGVEKKPIQGELSFKSTDDKFEARISSYGGFDWGWWAGVWWNSLQFKAGNNSISGDYIWGSIYVGTGWFPVNWISYFQANLDVHRDGPPNKDTYDWGNFTVDKSSSFIASSWLQIHEKNSTGHVVRPVDVSAFIWRFDAAKSTQLSNKTAGLLVAVFNGTRIFDPVFLELIYVMTDKAGVLNTAEQPLIIPKAIESFIHIKNWHYLHPENSLSIITVVGTGSSSWHYSGHLIAGSGEEQTFVRMAESALVDGEIKKVRLSGNVAKEGTIAFRNPAVEAQLTQRYKAEATVTFIEVDFPAGANDIEYDPTVGVGPDPYVNNNLIAIIVGSIVGFVVLVVLIGIMFYVFRKRAEYAAVD